MKYSKLFIFNSLQRNFGTASAPVFYIPGNELTDAVALKIVAIRSPTYGGGSNYFYLHSSLSNLLYTFPYNVNQVNDVIATWAVGSSAAVINTDIGYAVTFPVQKNVPQGAVTISFNLTDEAGATPNLGSAGFIVEIEALLTTDK